MKYILLIFSILAINFQVFSQKGTIKGKINNAKSNEPIEFANILIQGTEIGSTSDLDGNYIFTGIDPGFYRLVVSSVGFETTVSAEIQVQGNQSVFVDVNLPEAAFAIRKWLYARI